MAARLRREPLTGEGRQRVAAGLRRRYEAGVSIRHLADTTDWSYGMVHKLLREAGAEMRPRGGRGGIRAARY